MKRIISITLVVFSLIVAGCNSKPFSQRGSIFETYNSDWQGKTMLRVFESSVNGTDNWQEITTFRHDDPISFPKENIKILNENIGYFFLGWKYGITTDGGKTWSVWNVTKDLPNCKCENYGLIENVLIEKNGKGKMYFNELGEARSGISYLVTEDFGKTWHN
jgi:hypothetical protein